MKILSTLYFCLCFLTTQAQTIKIYNPDADAAKEINLAVTKAKAEKKFIFLQIGGNWCPWCVKFHENYLTDPEIKAVFQKGFVPVLINYSKENKNLKVLQSLEFPQRFGFPVFVIMDPSGKRIHTQNSVYLEEGNGYSKKKIIEFMKQWSPEALDPQQYRVKYDW